MNRNTDALLQLRLNVIDQFGKQIVTATDCENLAAILAEKLKANISAQTLRRFFGLIKASSQPSLYTLGILAKFCGFTDFHHFADFKTNSELELFFGSTEDSGNDYWLKSEQLCRQIADSPFHLATIHHRMMPFPLVRKYFMENHPMRDMLGTVYSQYFMSYLKFNQTNEARIFAYGFLYQSAFLQGNQELMHLFFQKVKETELSPEVFVIPAGLKFGITLHYADYIGDEILFNKTYSAMKASRERYISASKSSVCSFEYTVLESLIFTERKSEIRLLLENNTFQSSAQQNFIPSQRKLTHDEVWKILSAVGYHKIGDEETAKKFAERVNLENLGFGWQKYYSIIYYFLLLEIVELKEKSKILKKLHHLISETHFTHFEEKLSLYNSKKQQFAGTNQVEPLMGKNI